MPTRQHNGKTYTLSEAHPAADLFPWLEGDELQGFADDIKSNGQKQKIIRHRSRIVDGRNREYACLIAGIRPDYLDLPADTPEDKILAGIISANLKRRHLSVSQRAMIAAQMETIGHGGKRKVQDATWHLEPTREDLAAQHRVSPRTVARAAKVRDEAPELVEPVKSGVLPVATAARVAEYPEQIREAVANADNPKAAADELLADLEDPPEPTDDPPEPPDDFVPLNNSLPIPRIDAGKRPLPKGWTPGNQVDPDHPFADLLRKFSQWSAELTKLFKTELGKELMWSLADLSELKAPIRFVLFKSDRSDIDESTGNPRSLSGRFVGFYALRSLAKKVGLRGKRLTKRQIQKTFLDAVGANDTDILDSEG